MEPRIVIDEAQAIWGMQQAIKEMMDSRISPSPGLVKAILSGVPSPAMGFPVSGIVWLRKGIPEEYMEYIVDHEYTHVIIYKTILRENPRFPDYIYALKASKVLDQPGWHRTFAKVWGIDGEGILDWMKWYLANWYNPTKGFKKLIRRIRDAFSRKERGS